MLDLKNKLFLITILIVVVLQVLLAFQGFDVCDDGFVLTGYQQIFNAPESVEYNFAYWFSTFLGGLWYNLYPSGGVFWFKILAIIINTGTLIVTYKLLENYVKSWYLLAGLVMVLFVNDFGFLVYYHNQLTAFLTVLIAYFLHRGIVKSNLILIVLSGFFVGINIFARLPNLSLLVLTLAIPLNYYLKGLRFRKSLKPMLGYVFGAILGVLFTIGLMLVLNQWQIFKGVIETLFSLGNTRGSGHSILDMVLVFRYNYITILKLICILVVFLFVNLKVHSLINGRKILSYFHYILCFLCFGWFFVKGGIHSVYAFSLIGLIGVVFSKVSNANLKLIAAIAFLILVCLPLGSGGGMLSSGYMCIWIALPLSLYFFSDLNLFNSNFVFNKIKLLFKFSIVGYKFIPLSIVLAFLFVKSYAISKEAYFDPGNRFLKTYAIDNELANNVYTTKERADIINELLLELEKFVKPDDYLFTFDNVPMIHFLTKTKPYLYNPWVTIYDSYSFEIKLIKAEKEIAELPIVVQQKFETIYEFSEPISNYLDESHPTNRLYNLERTKSMNRFLKRNKYKLVWSNDYFNIYKSTKSK